MADTKSKPEKIKQNEQVETTATEMNASETTATESNETEQVVSESKVTSAYIDRIEETENGDKKAVLYIDDDDSDELPKIVLPVSVLPDEIYEGDYVLINITYDKEKSESK